jgi:hypothetical protein
MKIIKLILILILISFLFLELFTNYNLNKWFKALAYSTIVILAILDNLKKKE